MQDYSWNVQLMQKRIAEQFTKDATTLNEPGVSVACKIDPLYYLAPQPGFERALAAWAGLLPDTVKTTLLKTGNLLFAQSEDKHIATVSVKWTDLMAPVRIRASFILAGFIDNALKLYARRQEVLPVSELRICDREREALQGFFQRSTPPSRAAFGECG